MKNQKKSTEEMINLCMTQMRELLLSELATFKEQYIPNPPPPPPHLLHPKQPSSTTAGAVDSMPKVLQSAAATTNMQPGFGSPRPVFTFVSASVNNDQMSTVTEDSMAEDTVQATQPVTPVFGQQPAPLNVIDNGPRNIVEGQKSPILSRHKTPWPPWRHHLSQIGHSGWAQIHHRHHGRYLITLAPLQSNYVFGASTSTPAPTPTGASPFQFASQQNIAPPNPSPFQASGSLEFNSGGSFSLGPGGSDKSGRKIVRVNRNKLRKK